MALFSTEQRDTTFTSEKISSELRTLGERDFTRVLRRFPPTEMQSLLTEEQVGRSTLQMRLWKQHLLLSWPHLQVEFCTRSRNAPFFYSSDI